ncbi:dipeptide ABC transporter ATP-binding protein [Rhizobium leguminosarum bv. viciae]|nr:ABC transporter ATP-binding protein [Rhizobium leguminosarum]NKM79014.1 dipeptide ABC transporter ATP-binding protein [Rhizobium leguminosarum bv. viciae]
MLRDRLDPKAAVKRFPVRGRFLQSRSRTVHNGSPGIAESNRLEVEDLVVEISTPQGVIRALDGVSFSVKPGETVALVGESGSGKSMTGLSIMQLLPRGVGRIARGRVLYVSGDGENARTIDLSQVPAEEFRAYRGSEIGMVFQEPMSCLNPVYTVGYQLEEALVANRRMTPGEARSQAEDELRRVGIPDPARRLNEYPHQLSGGMRQRVAIAIALCGRPKLLIADEPTTALDVTVQAQILDLIQRLQKEDDMSVIFITHDMGVVAEIADRVLVMYKGQLVEQAETVALFKAPQHPYTQKLLKAVPRLGSMKNEPAPRKMTGVDGQGNEVATNSKPLLPKPGMPLLEVNGLTKRFEMRSGIFHQVTGRLHAVEDVSFTLQPSETLSVVGESGCGKSTTGRSILQLIKPDSGSVKFEGSEIVGASTKELDKLRCKMQIIFQDPFGSLNPRVTVGKAIAEPIVLHKLATPKQAMEQAVELLRKVGLSPDMADRFPHAFSGGQRQRICIARALALNPKLIIADEAVSALDVSIKAQVLNLLLDLQAEFGLSYLFISHDMATVEQVSHRIAVMYLGEIVEIGPRAAIIENPQHPYTQKLLSAVPVADPSHRGKRRPVPVGDLPSPLRRPDYVAVPRCWRQVAEGHLVQEVPPV